ncbi:MAG TPA: hypothetical protein VFD60_12515 [Nitrososphaeraceae archaeon]|nr:hypothetical protein [Nitrososphaeraceae archaeon]
MEGELVRVYGNVSDGTGFPVNKDTIIQVNFVNNSAKVPPIRSSWMNFIMHEDYNGKNPIYRTVVSPVNGSYSVNLLNTAHSGTYFVSAFTADSGQTANTYFEVENPLTTFTATMIYVAITLVIILLVVLAFGAVSVYLMEITTFILISGIVISPIIGLGLADSVLGPNSPVGLVLKHPTGQKDGKGGGEWIINIGGNQRNNYGDGLNIPVYVVVFGIAGGYLRYLYEAATTNRKETKEEFAKIRQSIKPEFYEKDWQYHRLPLTSRLSLHKSNKNMTQEELRNKIIFQLTQHEILKEKRKYYLYKSIRNVALIFLSPLLAIAVWFLLVQAGVQSEQPANGQAGIFILGAVSFTVGLVTDEVVQLLTNFVKERLGLAKEQQDSKKLGKSTLSAVSTVKNNPVSRGNKQAITILVSDDKTKESIPNASIHGTVICEQPREKPIKISGITDKSGVYSYEWPISHDSPAGEYTIDLIVSASGYENQFIKNKFNVIDGFVTQGKELTS